MKKIEDPDAMSVSAIFKLIVFGILIILFNSYTNYRADYLSKMATPGLGEVQSVYCIKSNCVTTVETFGTEIDTFGLRSKIGDRVDTYMEPNGSIGIGKLDGERQYWLTWLSLPVFLFAVFGIFTRFIFPPKTSPL